MPPIFVPLGVFERGVGNFPDMVSQNMLAEKVPTDMEEGYDLISRPGYIDFASGGEVGLGPLRGMFRKAGVFSGDTIIVSGTAVIRLSTTGIATTLTGTVPGVDRVQMDGTTIAGVSTVRIANGTGLYKVNDTSVTAETLPDSCGAISVAELDGFWFFVRTDTQQIYDLVPGDVVWSAISYSSAEAEPDNLVGLMTLGDELWAFGEASTQPFALTGTADPSIRPVPGRRFDVGCKDRDTIVRVKDALMWVDENGIVQEAQAVPQAVSDSGLAETIRSTSGALRAFYFMADKHALYVLRIGNDMTWVFDAETRLPTHWASKDRDYFRPHMGVDVGGLALVGDSETAAVFRMSPSVLTDDGDEIIRKATGFLPVKEGVLPCSNITLHCATGVGLSTGQGSDPMASVRISKDLGNTFGPLRTVSLGEIGRYETRPKIRGWGTIRAPGAVIEVSVSDPVTFRLSGLSVNAP